MKSLLSTLALSLALIAQPALAHDYKAGSLRVIHPYATPSLPGVPNAAGYADLSNGGAKADRLLRAASPAAERVELHEMKMEGDLMRMREVAAIDLPAGATVKMGGAGGLHLMFLNLKQPLKAGDKFPLTLSFEQAGDVRVEVVVQEKAAGAKAMEAHHKH